MAKVAAAPGTQEALDRRTIFIRNIAFATTDSKLEETFSAVGPVRQCFLVKEKGSEQHRGFGFVQFALPEDAQQAVETLGGSLLDGRKLRLEIAHKRAPLDQRRPRAPADTEGGEAGEGDAERGASDEGAADDGAKKEPEAGPKEPARGARKRKQPEGSANQETGTAETGGQEQKAGKPDGKATQAGEEAGAKKGPSKKARGAEGKASDRQRPARMVVLGAKGGAALPQAALALAQQVASWEVPPHALTSEERTQHNLGKDGCPEAAAMLVYSSVRGANQAVAALHGKEVEGATLWARQFGGQGAKLKKCRLIVRNLPFQVSEAQLREAFSAAGFVWEITLPRNADGRARGFAFIGYTSKDDAEKAVRTLNAKPIGGRTVAVDWAVAKREYAAGAGAGAGATREAPAEEREKGDKEASESMEADYEVQKGGHGAADSDDETASESTLQPSTPPKSARAPKKKKTKREASKEGSQGSKAEGQDGADGEDGDLADGADADVAPVNEGLLMRQVLERVLAAGPPEAMDEDDITEEIPVEKSKARAQKAKAAEGKKGTEHTVENGGKKGAERGARKEDSAGKGAKKVGEEGGNGGSEGTATLFVRRLPANVKADEVREAFAKFGTLKACRLVLHPVTKRPVGTAFIEYRNLKGAQAAVDAGGKKAGQGGAGVLVRGTPVAVSLAVGKEEARQISREKAGSRGGADRRSLHLAQEGVIVEGSPAAQEMAATDWAKRQRLQQEKATKLRSPNFVVSRTRLAVHNVPPGMGEAELRQLFLRAVKERATKQNPTITQVKILRDKVKKGADGRGRPQGAAFVEFSEHEHATTALRALNNNPGVFSTERRPIVEFAIENRLLSKKLEMLKAKGGKGGDSGGAPQGKGGREKQGHTPAAEAEYPGALPMNPKKRGVEESSPAAEPPAADQEAGRRKGGKGRRKEGPKQAGGMEPQVASGSTPKVPKPAQRGKKQGGAVQQVAVTGSKGSNKKAPREEIKAKKEAGEKKQARKEVPKVAPPPLQLDVKKLGDLKRWFE